MRAGSGCRWGTPAGAAGAATRARALGALFLSARGLGAGRSRARRGAARAGLADDACHGSLGGPGASTQAASFYAGMEISAVDYSPALEFSDPLAAPVPFSPPTRTQRPAPTVSSPRSTMPLMSVWSRPGRRRSPATAPPRPISSTCTTLTPVHEAALRAFPSLPIVGQLHGTELAFLRALAAGPPQGWRHARAWEERLRRWARACERLIVPPGAEGEVAALLGVERFRLCGFPSGVELERFRPAPVAGERRHAFWRRWLVECAQGWDEPGAPGKRQLPRERALPPRLRASLPLPRPLHGRQAAAAPDPRPRPRPGPARAALPARPRRRPPR